MFQDGYGLSVPHNAMDIVAKQWLRGDEGNAAKHRTMKYVRPHRLPDDAVVRYAWQLDGDESAVPALISAARGVVALGWGSDLVVGGADVIDGTSLADLSAGARVWEPRSDGRQALRAPQRGTVADLERRHAAFLSRTSLAEPTLRPPSALSAFAITRYARADEPRKAAVACFTLMRVESDNFRAFDTARLGMVVAGMLRHAVRTAAARAGWDETRINATVLGHGEAGARLLLVPVPSIEPRGAGGEAVGAVRRVMVFSTDEGSADTAWVERALGGMDLINEKTSKAEAILSVAPRGDRVLGRYIAESSTWTTVTPLVLPGHDDPGGLRAKLGSATDADEQKELLYRLMKRRDALVRKALRHAGLGDDLAFSAQIQIGETGFLAGVEKASRYAVPSHLAMWPRFHVKLSWPRKVGGPLCLGRGRFSGLGLFAPIEA